MIETSRTLLRSFTEDDLANLRLLDADPDIMKWTPAKIPQTFKQSKIRLARYKEMQGVWACELKDTQEFVGWFMLIPTDLDYPELGFMLVKKYWGKGLATEIAQTVIDYGFNSLGAKGIAARTILDNVQSIQVLKKLNFVHVKNLVNADGIELLIFHHINFRP
jgi:ribosomal-protein-alanine N-acetyltransferase